MAADKKKLVNAKPKVGTFLWWSILDPFYDVVVVFIPYWYTPNMVTITGGVFAFLSVIIAKTHVFLSCFFLFCYMSCDALDGKHARRTKQCSKAGAFLDHAVDGSFGNTAMLMQIMNLLCSGNIKSQNLIIFTFEFCFYTAHIVDLLVHFFSDGVGYLSVVEIWFFGTSCGLIHGLTGLAYDLPDLAKGLCTFNIMLAIVFGCYKIISRREFIKMRNVFVSIPTFILYFLHIHEFYTKNWDGEMTLSHEHHYYLVGLLWTLTFTSFYNH